MAKAAGIKANSPKAELVNALIALNNGNEGENKDETKKKPEDKGIKSTKKGKNLVNDLEDDMYPPFFLVTSSGPAAEHKSSMFGLYCKTKQMKEGRSVYRPEHDSKNGHENEDYKLFSVKGVWVVSGESVEDVEDLCNVQDLKAAAPSKTPTTVKWQYISTSNEYYDDYYTWHDDPMLTVTGITKKPIGCEVTISLSQDEDEVEVTKEMAGVYRADGSYREGWPVLQHSGGRFTLSVHYDNWRVESSDGDDDDEGDEYLCSGSVSSQCPADPRAALGNEDWSVKCNTCIHK